MHEHGPQRLDKFMRAALTQYYASRDPLGVDGDFITAPEISQLFGEMIGIWAVQKWEAMGEPDDFNLIEIGPGRGTLMADFLRGTKNFSAFHKSLNLHLVETSPSLVEKQKQTLLPYSVQWHAHLSEIETDKPTIIIANEFFDALPIQQFKYMGGQWLEHYIVDGATQWRKADAPPNKPTLPQPAEGYIVEISQDQADYAALMDRYNGSFLIIDYGYLKSSYGYSLQALYKHAPCAITDHVGDADLTTHIDFEWIASFFTKAKIHLSTQAQFLKTNGIDIRLDMLGREKLYSGYDRLTNPSQMGALFKVMEVDKFPTQTD